MYRGFFALAWLLVTITTLPPSALGAAPSIAEWLNQSVRLRETVNALDQPAADGKSLGSIAAGAEVKAIGVVAGGEWVQIELPNKALAYVPKAAIALGGGAAAPATPAAAATGMVSGTVGKVPNAATLVVGDKRIRLWGIDPGPTTVLPEFETWLRQNAGTLRCDPVAETGRYRCVTSNGSGVPNGTDVAAVALYSGFARVGEGASADYRKLEDQAREANPPRGLWKSQ